MRLNDTRRTSRSVAVLLLLLGLGLAAPSAARAQERSLYTRLGGYDAITAVVNTFADRLFTDPSLRTFFGGLSAEHKTRFKQLNVLLVCSATGGPCSYIGASMPASHAGLGIDSTAFNKVAGHLVATLDQFKVPAREKAELLTIIGTLRPAIVER